MQCWNVVVSSVLVQLPREVYDQRRCPPHVPKASKAVLVCHGECRHVPRPDTYMHSRSEWWAVVSSGVA